MGVSIRCEECPKKEICLKTWHKIVRFYDEGKFTKEEYDVLYYIFHECAKRI